MMSRPPISPGNSGAATTARWGSLCGLSRGRSATAPLPRPGGRQGGLVAQSGAPGDHAMSVAMPDCPANSGETDHPLAGQKVPVMLPLPLPEPLDYRVSDGAAVPEPGSFVRVTLGSRPVIGVVWEGAGEESGSALPLDRLKPIGEILPTP